MTYRTKFTIELFDEHSKNIFEYKKHAFIGISPFNGYFNENNIRKLLWVSSALFNELTIFVPDQISAYTLQGLGYDENKAKAKTRKHDKNLLNKIQRICQEKSISQKILTFSEIAENRVYKEVYNDCIEYFNHDKAFRQGCLSTVRGMLTNHIGVDSINESRLMKAVDYLLYELPVYMDTPRILGVDSSLIIYHATAPFIKNLYIDRKWVSPLQGYLQLTINPCGEKISLIEASVDRNMVLIDS